MSVATLFGQERGRIFRTERIPYAVRQDAEQHAVANSGHIIEFRPHVVGIEQTSILVSQQVEIPFVWTDGDIYLHAENIRSAYTLTVNGQEVARMEDSAAPAEFALTPYIRQGVNEFQMFLRDSGSEVLNAEVVARKAFSGSYLYYQDKRSIRDFEIALVPDSAGRQFGMLDLKIIAQNTFNYEEPVTVGYDIYSPQGKLLEFNITEVTIPGHGVDTIRFSPFIYGAYDQIWSAEKRNPPLYKVMLFTRRDGAYKEYMPLRIGFGQTRLEGGKLMRLGKEITLKKVAYNAAKTPTETRAQLLSLKAKGNNTICPSYPQPAWFYALCDEIGLYVIDCANINASDKREDRRVGGTPSNDPSLVEEYLTRVKAMYYRSRNFTCGIGYALGGNSGNGYNMYKAYQWLKGVEKHRPVIYGDAAGEWNSDLVE